VGVALSTLYDVMKKQTDNGGEHIITDKSGAGKCHLHVTKRINFRLLTRSL